MFSKLGIPPDKQILDDNFHHDIVRKLSYSEKRGRPDLVHFALLDATSTPLFQEGVLKVVIHTINDITIRVNPGVRIPRTDFRFCGLMSKLLSQIKGREKNQMFEVIENQSISELVSNYKGSAVISLTRAGRYSKLREFVEMESDMLKKVVWVVGGFPHGHFDEELIKVSHEIISISNTALPAHVVTARLSYDLEVKIGMN